MQVSIVIPNYHRDIGPLLASIPEGYEIIVVNNDDLSLAEKRNYGVLKSTKELIYFVDDDNILDFMAIVVLSWAFKIAKTDGINMGIVGSVAKFKDRIIDGGSHRHLLSGFMSPATGQWLYEVDEVANAFMVKREVFDKIGLFDEERFPMDMDEADLCLRAKRAGYKIFMYSESIVYHPLVPRLPKFRRKRSAYYMGRNRILFQRKHLGIKFPIFLIFFMPIFVLIYLVSLTILGQVNFIPTFLKGVIDGIQNRFQNKY